MFYISNPDQTQATAPKPRGFPSTQIYLCPGHEDANRNRNFRESGLPDPLLVTHTWLWWTQRP